MVSVPVVVHVCVCVCVCVCLFVGLSTTVVCRAVHLSLTGTLVCCVNGAFNDQTCCDTLLFPLTQLHTGSSTYNATSHTLRVVLV